ncbi:hypothetical protein GCM10023322_00480 [Rugosimonospora acidiphila]|uniref:Uncharacterized protein n=1 Tax=Rugosimonospora acidiphila TaxID=556531 RepID=A0ABP9RFV4_9ACTN
MRIVAHPEDSADRRFAELRRLGDRERNLAKDLAETRDAIARLVTQLLPAHALAGRIEPVAARVGVRGGWVEQPRRGKLWLR